MIKRNVIIVDLDGTLYNNEHRAHLAHAGKWDEFHAMSYVDEPFQDVQEFVRMAYSSKKIVVALTGRSDDYELITRRWFRRHNVKFNRLLMRPQGNHAPDTEIKPMLLEKYFGSMDRALGKVLCILEDRDKVVAEWRKLGFRCWQVTQGNY